MLAPALQLIHVSDLHLNESVRTGGLEGWRQSVVDAANRQGAIRRYIARFLIRRALGDIEGHDPTALEMFRADLPAAVKDPDEDGSADWRDRTWLIATGDLSTWGDTRSIQSALNWLRETAERHNVRWTAIYGNHDVWPRGFPLSQPAHVLDGHRSLLRHTAFPEDWPLVPIHAGTGMPGAVPLRVALRSPGAELLAASLNTVRHERPFSTFAMGKVTDDRYWESAGLEHQLRAVDAIAAGAVLVLLTHHPIHDPARWPPWMGLLANRRRVARALRSHRRLIVVSGHTHRHFPNSFIRQDGRRRTRYRPLGRGQIQLIIGSLSQADPLDDGRRRQQWQRLRMWEDDSTGEIAIRRTVFERARAGFFERISNERLLL